MEERNDGVAVYLKKYRVFENSEQWAVGSEEIETAPLPTAHIHRRENLMPKCNAGV